MFLLPTPISVAWGVAGPFVKRFWKPAAIVIAVGVGFWSFHHWLDKRDAAHEAKGFSAAEAQFKAQVEAANLIAKHDEAQMTVMAGVIDRKLDQRTGALNLTVNPKIERIQSEVANDPRYRECAVSDGVLGEANAVRAAVDASINSSNPAAH